ncbi:MAG TPA: outer membrane lipoprotein carrier protein LolA [Paludibacter sp.]
MKKNIIYAFILVLFSATNISAQNNPQAEKILSDLLLSAKTSAIKTNFKLATNDKNTSQAVATGTFTLKGNKFVLDMDDMKVWFDGKTQWAYNQQNNEVSITEPTEKELSDTNPMAILSAYKAKCLIKFSNKTKSAQNHCIEMTPKVKNKDIAKIEVQVNKTNANLFSIKLINTNGSTSLLTVNNFQNGLKVADNFFVFNQSKYKGISVNDLR